MENNPPQVFQNSLPVSLSASVLFVKPVDNVPHLLILERSSNTRFGGIFAFPGGKVETQDVDFISAAQLRYEQLGCKWASDVIALYSFHDISLRIACLREVYEEIGILLCYKDGVYTVLHKADLEGTPGTEDFAQFGVAKGVVPAVDRLKAWKRIAPPQYIKQRNDTQFYLYFIENGEEQGIEINNDEHSNMLIDSVDSILQKYNSDDIFMVLPQAVIIAWTKYFGEYTNIVEAAERSDKSIMSYLEMRSEIVPVPDNSLDDKQKQISEAKFKKMVNFYDEYDSKRRDKEGHLISFDLLTPKEYIFDNKDMMKLIGSPNDNSGLKIMVRVYPGDVAHPNENYPWEVKQNYRY